MSALLMTLHVLAAVIWVGGMFFAYMALRPAAGELDPPSRTALWGRTFARFFAWVWAAIIVLPVTGYLTTTYLFRRFLQHCRGLACSDDAVSFSVADAAIGRIRRTLAINLILGLIVVAVAMAGRALGLS